MIKKLFNKLYGPAIQQIQKSVHVFEALGNGRYIRHSDLENWGEAHRTPITDSFLFRILEVLGSDDKRRAVVSKYRLIIKTPSLARKKANALYLEEALDKYSDFFDEVESNPLTDKQRESCIMDEDYNLVLAGAGSGKTSVIVARAGLIEKAEWAKPDEILILAFGNKAAQETHERIQLRLGADSQIMASTFHSLGLKIIGEARQEQPSLHRTAANETVMHQFIDEQIEKQVAIDGRYAADLVTYFRYYLCPSKEPEQFDTIGEYYEHLDSLDLKTLQGERVKSWQELHIANFLFCNCIEYEYEAPYEYRTADASYRQYVPDFKLTRSGTYIEHFGIDKNGNPNPKFSPQERKHYLDGIRWKRQLHKDRETRLIETTSADFSNGSIDKKLTSALEQAGESIKSKSTDQILEYIRNNSDAPSKISHLISRFLNLQKNNRLSIEEIKSICYGTDGMDRQLKRLGYTHYLTARLRAFYRVYYPIYQAYEDELSRSGHVDFNDMINEATDLVLDGKYRPNWKFILVDEFQDISESRASLVKALIKMGPRASLFCVGDDWQSIYRFTGSDIRYTSEFNGQFGVSAITALDKTFRFNQEISEVATNFVVKNPAQQKKQILAMTSLEEPAVSVVLHGKTDEKRALKRTLDRIQEIEGRGSVCSIYILSRFHFRKPDSIGLLKREYPSFNIRCETAHASKGKEADYVIITGMNTERFGFPSDVETDPIIELLLPPSEHYQHAEERRLFYVALTRSRKRSFALANRANYSAFVHEFLTANNPLVEITDIDQPDGFEEPITCPKCKSGKLTLKNGTNDDFFGCSNYPYCKHTQSPCVDCNQSPVIIKQNEAVCPACSTRPNVCPVCLKDGIIAQLLIRTGNNGQFWGCENYRGNDGHSCHYTRPIN